MKHLATLLLILILSSINIYSTHFNSSGASFPYKFLQSSFNSFSEKNNISVHYSTVGSKQGYLDLKNEKVDFSGVDLFLNDTLLSNFPENKEILHIPICLSGIGIAYNIPNVGNIKLTAKIISQILLGQIKTWNHDSIKIINPKLKLPDLDIIVILRDKGSGSTYILTQYLSSLDLSWKNSFGISSTLFIPGTLVARDTSSMGKLISQIPGSFGYIGYSYAKDYNLTFAKVENSAGYFIEPTNKSISKSADIKIPKDARISLTSSSSKFGYPLSSFSWLILYKEQSYNKKTLEDTIQLKSLLTGIVTTEQEKIQDLGYAKLPYSVRQVAIDNINSITYKNKQIKNQ